MLRITIEKVPYGISERSYVMHRGTITNDGSGTVTRGNYRVAFGRRNGKAGSGKAGHVRDFERRKDGAWKLLKLGLQDCYPSKPRGEDAMAVLLKRGGFDDWWYSVDTDIRMDIMNELNEALE